MEVLLLFGALAAGHHYLTQDEPVAPVAPQAVHSAQSIGEIVNFGHDDVSLASIDWSKAGNSIVGDSSENGIQWIFITN
jgi:hypothetical protein